MRIAIAGVAGRMGRMVAEICAEQGLALAGGTLRAGEAAPEGVTIFADAAALAASCDALIDFTNPAAVADHARACAGHGIAWVLGTTGLSKSDQAAIDRASREIAVVQAANFSAGVTIMLELARQLGAALPAGDYDAEILEMHHGRKLDAPSGTALALGRAVANGRGEPDQVLPGPADRSGARPPGAIGFASLRGGQVVGRHSLLFASEAEHITITHEALDRRVFAAGAVRAALWTQGRPPGLYGMNDVLGIGRPA